MKIYFATGNPNKLEEVRSCLEGIVVEQVRVDLPELQGEPVNIALEKARLACEKTGKPIVVDDTSLCCHALGGLPGPYVKEFLVKIGPEGIYCMLTSFKDFSAYTLSCVGYCEPGSEPLVFKGRVNGTIVSPRGDNGFLIDTIFVPHGGSRTYAEMTKAEKNKVSHRTLAFEALKQYLQNK